MMVGIFGENREYFHAGWFGFAAAVADGSLEGTFAVGGVFAALGFGVDGVARQVQLQIPEQTFGIGTEWQRCA